MKLSIIPNYRNIYCLVYIVNIVIGILFSVNNAEIKAYNTESIILLVLMCIFSFTVILLFFRKRKVIKKIDLLFMWTYVGYMVLFLILCINYQRLYPESFSLLYFKNCLIIPYIIFMIEGFLIKNKKVNLQKKKN